jgi:hypothetical protein
MLMTAKQIPRRPEWGHSAYKDIVRNVFHSLLAS